MAIDLSDPRQRDFIKLYLHHCGQSEVPTSLHLWSAISLLASTLTARCWVPKFADEPVLPNLYVMLIAPSTAGKDIAINAAMRLASEIAEPLGLYNGAATAPFIVKTLEEQTDAKGASRLWLITKELAQSVNTGEHASAFVRYMTGLYTPSPVPFKKGTITGKLLTVPANACINWLAGTDISWLIDALTATEIKGGFLRRFVCVPEKYNLDRRFTRPLYPADRERIGQYLRARLSDLLEQSGQMVLTTAAAEIEDRWYRDRPAPSEELMVPTWRYQHDLIYKLGMVCAKARDPRARYIEAYDWERATRLAAVAERGASVVIHHANLNRDSQKTETVRGAIKAAGQIGRVALLRRTGLPVPDLNDALRDLVELGQVIAQRVPHTHGPATFRYVWLEDNMPTANTEGAVQEESTSG